MTTLRPADVVKISKIQPANAERPAEGCDNRTSAGLSAMACKLERAVRDNARPPMTAWVHSAIPKTQI